MPLIKKKSQIARTMIKNINNSMVGEIYKFHKAII